MEKDLLIRHFNNPPSQQEFAILENANVPALLKGCVTTWPAFHLWNPSNGGIARLKHLAGAATVQIMASSFGPNFYGNIRNHERIPTQFASFLNLIEGNIQKSELALLKSQDAQVYLAQAGIFNRENERATPLRGLLQDVAIPAFLRTSVAAINLWMSVSGSRSSTHYDPFHNLLCVISGSKQVKLWPPSCAPSLYALPVSGEASNHSGVDFADPDLARFPKFREAVARCQSATLCAGDALFLPEGWFHQVDSEGVTVAVNLWWPSEVAGKLGTHMDAYLLRRVVANLVDSEKEVMVREFRRCVSGGAAHVSDVRKRVKECVPDVKKPVADVKKPVADVKERVSDVKEPVTDVVEKKLCVAEPGEFGGGSSVDSKFRRSGSGGVAHVSHVRKPVTDVVEEPCVAEPGKCVDASRKCAGASGKFDGASDSFVGASDSFVGASGEFIGAPVDGEFVGASVNVQNAEGSRKKMSKRDRRRSKVLAMKAAQDSSEVGDLRAALGSAASPSFRHSEDVEKSCVGEAVSASVNVQNADGKGKKSKRDRRRSKVRATKAALDSSEVDHSRASNPSPSEDISGPNMAQKPSATSLSNAEVQALRTLIICVSDMMMSTSDNSLEDASQKLEDTSQVPQDTSQVFQESSQGLEDTSHGLGNDTSQGFGNETIAAVLATLEAPSLQRILLVMSVEYPRTLEAMILHKLSPLGCEVLTRRFEEMDADADAGLEGFYAQIYSVFDDPGMAMAALVDGKEALAALALQRVLDGNLGVSCTLKS